MKKGLTITIIILAVVGIVVLLSKKLRLILGFPVSYKSDASGETYKLELKSGGDKKTRAIVAYNKSGQKAGVVFINADKKLIWQTESTNQFLNTEVINEKDAKFFGSLLK